MPFSDLPLSVEEVLAGVDLPPDHIDAAPDGTAGGPLDKKVPVVCRNEEDAGVLRRSGFAGVTVLTEEGGLRLAASPSAGTVEPCGEEKSVVFSREDEAAFYLAVSQGAKNPARL